MTHRARNTLHTAALLAAIGAMTAIVGALVAGPVGAILALGVVGVSLMVQHQVATRMLLRRLAARALPPHALPGLHRLLAALSARAGLPVPRLYVLGLQGPQAMAMGSAEEPVVALTLNLLDRLEPRQLAGVLAHELSHLRHGDLRVLRLADAATVVVAQLSRFGLLAVFVAMLLGAGGSLWSAALLFMAPMVLLGLRQALSRTREFAADAEAARLTGDPRALAEALLSLERPAGPWWRAAPVLPRPAGPHWLDSHPPTEERVRRLLA